MNEERKEYLDGLADDFGLPKKDVFMIASFLGSTEDYDGLVTELEDYADRYHNQEVAQ